MIDEMVGTSVAMQCVRAAVERFAHCAGPLVLIGETGTGKSRLARLLTALGPRRLGPYISIDGAAWEQGHVPADVRYAWAAATGGTLFIDHIGEAPAAMQMRLAELLICQSSGAPRPRLIVSNPRRLEQAVAMGIFYHGLLAQLHRMAIHLPALRHRLEDIPPLARHFLRRVAEHGRHYQLARASHARLQNHAWPGNIRELNNVLRRAMVLAGTRTTLQPRDIVFDARGFAAQSAWLGDPMRLGPTP